ncbi:family 16 glycosylhydrolase [Ruminococcus sp.]|uniref:family 16 glycosylhydrolase n=1 Tax=Ruminococcus sp. TaxID=41978 RepID=UPI0025E90C5C|nr:family 16 glycosylhydrolase [Ruminococcus sp.]
MKITRMVAALISVLIAGNTAVVSSAAGKVPTEAAVLSDESINSASGDVNGDGEFSIADIVSFQKWLLSAPGAELADWKAADFCEDNKLDVFDLCLMKRRYFEHDSKPRLLWSDEFDGDTLDMTKWAYELGNWKLDANGNFVTYGWGNDEREFYTDSNTTVHDGILTISARKENYTDPVQGAYEYTSARISTQHLFSTCGGRIEVRARCDSGKSLWPAIWMLPEDSVYGGWAASGEIDIMEGWGSTPDKICGTVHFGDAWPNNAYLTKDYVFADGDSTENWHTYAIEWESGEIRWYVDDVLYSTQTDWYSTNHAYPAPFDQNFYIILNLAVGGKFDGVDGIYADPSIFANGERRFEIDYVRVYDLDKSFKPTPVTSAPLEAYIESADAVLVNKDGETEITINNVGSLEYGVMGLVRGNKVRAGEKHTLSFDISSTAVRDMVLTVEDSSYTRYLDEKIALSPNKTHYSFDVEFNSDMTVDYKFQLGNIGEAASSGKHIVTIQNIKWE